MEEQQIPKQKKNNACEECGLAKEIPKIPMYGPYNIKNQLQPGKTYLWCTCGLSKSQPWCDSSHKGTNFKPLKYTVPNTPQTLFSICGCKYTRNPPHCDGTHGPMPANPDVPPCIHICSTKYDW